MIVNSGLVKALTLSSLLITFVILTQPFGRCDPMPVGPPLYGVDVEGARIVSEGAYFRFWIHNNNSFSIDVNVFTPEHTMDNFIVPANGSINYDVIAPKISVAYEQVTYEFWLSGPNSSGQYVTLADCGVIVVNYGFVQIFSFSVELLIMFAAIIVALVAIVVVRRRRGGKRKTHKTTKPTNQKMIEHEGRNENAYVPTTIERTRINM